MKQPSAAFISVLYKTTAQDLARITAEFKKITPHLYFIDNTKNNEGYAQGVNRGLKKALQDISDIFIITNPDISVSTVTLNDIIKLSQQFDIGGFALKQNRETYYGGEIDRWRMSGGLITNKPSNRYTTCDFVSGSLMVIKREVIEKVGLFDESYGMYYEDVDYCIRTKKAGFTVGIDSHVIYNHFETSDANPQKKKHLSTNRKKILQKYGNVPQKLLEIIKPL